MLFEKTARKGKGWEKKILGEEKGGGGLEERCKKQECSGRAPGPPLTNFNDGGGGRWGSDRGS